MRIQEFWDRFQVTENMSLRPLIMCVPSNRSCLHHNKGCAGQVLGTTIPDLATNRRRIRNTKLLTVCDEVEGHEEKEWSSHHDG